MPSLRRASPSSYQTSTEYDNGHVTKDRESPSSLQEWMTEDGGTILLQLPAIPAASSPLNPLGRALSRTSLSSVSTAVPACAEIVATECYSERAGPVLHRFVLLELRRPERKNIWLRLDRRRGKNVSIARFLSGAGVTDANDRAMLSASKSELAGTAFAENEQRFPVAPTLRELVRLLRIIGEEIVQYRIWPENCWFFCSLIQQHLEGAQAGWFMNGSPKYQSLAHNIRIRISARVWKGHRPDVPILAPGSAAQANEPMAASPPPPSSTSPLPRSSDTVDLLHDMSPVKNAPSPVFAPLRWSGFDPGVLEKLNRLAGATDTGSVRLAQLAKDCLDKASQLSALESVTPRDLVLRLSHITDAIIALVAALPTDHTDDASYFLREAIRIHQSSWDHLPIRIRLSSPHHLNSAATKLLIRGQDEQANLFATAAVTELRACYALHPSQSRNWLASAVNTLAKCLTVQGRLDEAIVLGYEEIQLYRIVYALYSAGYKRYLVTALHGQSNRLIDVGQREDGVKVLESAMVLCREVLPGMGKEKVEADRKLLDVLADYVAVLDGLGRQAESRAAQEELQSIQYRAV